MRASLALRQKIVGGVIALLAVLNSHRWALAGALESEGGEQGRIILLTSLAWEGEDLSTLNIEAIARFRVEFPELRLVHFVDPAYFARAGGEIAAVASKMRQIIHQDDITGLHLHAWKSTVEASGVAFRTEPTFWGQLMADERCGFDCGHEVPISMYTAKELSQLVKKSLAMFTEAGWERPRSFMAGGWMASPEVLSVVAEEGFTHDFSAVAPELLSERLAYYPLHDWLTHLWQGLDKSSQPQPYYVKHGKLWQVVQNGAAIDYRSAHEVIAWYQESVAAWRRQPQHDLILHLGFHQESAHRYLPRLRKALHGILAHNQTEKIPFTFFHSLAQDLQPQWRVPHSKDVSLTVDSKPMAR